MAPIENCSASSAQRIGPPPLGFQEPKTRNQKPRTRNQEEQRTSPPPSSGYSLTWLCLLCLAFLTALPQRAAAQNLNIIDSFRLVGDGAIVTFVEDPGTYLNLFRITSYKILQLEGREVSIFNFGSPSATFEANTREQSIFNFGSPSAAFEANSREISIYNGEAVPYSDLLQIETREVSIFNFGEAAPGTPGGPPALAEAITREISVFNGEAVPPSDLLQIETREVSTFNFGSPSAPIEAISREVSVLNFDEPG